MSNREVFDYSSSNDLDASQWTALLDKSLVEQWSNSDTDTLEIQYEGRKIILPVVVVAMLVLMLSGCMEAMQSREYLDMRGQTALVEGAPPAEVTATMAAFDRAQARAEQPPADMYGQLPQSQPPGRYPAPGGPAGPAPAPAPASTSLPAAPTLPPLSPRPLETPTVEAKPPPGLQLVQFGRQFGTRLPGECDLLLTVLPGTDPDTVAVGRYMEGTDGKVFNDTAYVGTPAGIGSPPCDNPLGAHTVRGTLYFGDEPGKESVEVSDTGFAVPLNDNEAAWVPAPPQTP